MLFITNLGWLNDFKMIQCTDNTSAVPKVKVFGLDMDKIQFDSDGESDDELTFMKKTILHAKNARNDSQVTGMRANKSSTSMTSLIVLQINLHHSCAASVA